MVTSNFSCTSASQPVFFFFISTPHQLVASLVKKMFIRSQFSYLVGGHCHRGCCWQRGDIHLGRTCFAARALMSLRPMRRLQCMGQHPPGMASGHHSSNLSLGSLQVLGCHQRTHQEESYASLLTETPTSSRVTFSFCELTWWKRSANLLLQVNLLFIVTFCE